MLLREMMCSGRERMRGALFPGEASTRRLYGQASGSAGSALGGFARRTTTRPPARSAGSARPRGRGRRLAKRGSGRDGSRTKASPSARSAPMNSSSRHFSSGSVKPPSIGQHVQERAVVDHQPRLPAAAILRAACCSSISSRRVRSQRCTSARQSAKVASAPFGGSAPIPSQPRAAAARAAAASRRASRGAAGSAARGRSARGAPRRRRSRPRARGCTRAGPGATG